MLQGTKTIHHSDVKVDVSAGMQFVGNIYKLQVVGYDIYRHYFDTKQKDWQVGSERIKRVFTV